jgi:oxygen-independent coproporphyrinogen-3 oxidase
MTLMCSATVEFTNINTRYGIEFGTYFAAELERLQPYQAAGLIEITPDAIHVTPMGRFFVRASGMVFDGYLGQPTTSVYSKII